MRSRRAVLLVLAVLTASFVAALHPAAFAAELIVAQEVDPEDAGDPESGGDTESDVGTETDEGSGRTDAETGADEGQVQETETEEGPPWTFQMARIIIVLLVLMMLGIGGLYWRLVVQRQRRGI